MSYDRKPRVAFVDDRLYAREFRTNDCVRKTGLRDFVLTPYAGRVLYSNPDTGVVVVQWPWGAENNTPTELVPDKSGDFGLPQLDQSYKTWESSRYTSSSNTEGDVKWRKSLAAEIQHDFREMTKPLYVDVSKLLYKNVPQAEAPRHLTRHESRYGSYVINQAVNDVYGEAHRIAMKYTKSTNKYEATMAEKQHGLDCPRCHTAITDSGRFQKVMVQCPVCGFSALLENIQFP